MSDLEQPVPQPAPSVSPPQVPKKKGCLKGCGFLLMVLLLVFIVGPCTMVMLDGPFTKTLTEIRSYKPLGFQQEPDETQTDDSGDWHYTWNRGVSGSKVVIITKGNTDNVQEIRSLVVNRNGNTAEGFSESITGFSTLGLIVDTFTSAPQEWKGQRAINWMVEHADEQGAEVKMGMLTVSVVMVKEGPDYRITMFWIH
jgi:hypothetical protein